jgi:formate dehydrogenase major subunit
VNSNPTVKYPRVPSHQPIGTADKFPYVLMTSTVAEHWCAGSTTRNIPWLNELVPEPVLELPISLAEKLSVKSGDWLRVSSARAALDVKAFVTPRMTGPSVNHLTIDASDPGAGTQESKACLVNIVKVRDREPRALTPGGRA